MFKEVKFVQLPIKRPFFSRDTKKMVGQKIKLKLNGPWLLVKRNTLLTTIHELLLSRKSWKRIRKGAIHARIVLGTAQFFRQKIKRNLSEVLNRILAGVEVLASIVDEDVNLGVSLVDLVTEPQQQGLLTSNGRHCWQWFCLLTQFSGPGRSVSFGPPWAGAGFRSQKLPPPSPPPPKKWRNVLFWSAGCSLWKSDSPVWTRPTQSVREGPVKKAYCWGKKIAKIGQFFYHRVSVAQHLLQLNGLNSAQFRSAQKRPVKSNSFRSTFSSLSEET